MSDDNGLRFFKVGCVLQNNMVVHQLERVTNNGITFKPIDGVPVKATFTGALLTKDLMFTCVMQSGCIYVFKGINAQGISSETIVFKRPDKSTSPCTILAASDDCKWLAVQYYTASPYLFSIDNQRLHSKVSLGFLDHSQPSTLCFSLDPNSKPRLVIVCNSNKFYM